MHRNHTRMGLQTQTSALVTTRLHRQSTQTIQPHKKRKENQPHPSAPILYGAKKQYATQPSSATVLEKKGKKFIQQVCGNFLFLGRAVNSTLLCPISAFASQSANPTKEKMRQTHQILHYITAQEDAVIIYTNSNMKLAVHGDAS